MVLAVNVEAQPAAEPGAPPEVGPLRGLIQGFQARSNLTLPVYVVDGRTQGELGIDRIPFSVLLDAQGKVVRAYAGYSQAQTRELRDQAVGLLAKPRPKGKGGK
jgi:hypothetical protein